jgi:hypothetical protein
MKELSKFADPAVSKRVRIRMYLGVFAGFLAAYTVLLTIAWMAKQLLK